MILNGELDTTKSKVESNVPHSNNDFSEELHSSLLQNMTHLSKQEEKGISGKDRWNEIFRIIITLLVLGGLIWFLFYRK